MIEGGLQVGETDHEVEDGLVLLELLGQGLDLALPDKAQFDSVSQRDRWSR